MIGAHLTKPFSRRLRNVKSGHRLRERHAIRSNNPLGFVHGMLSTFVPTYFELNTVDSSDHSSENIISKPLRDPLSNSMHSYIWILLPLASFILPVRSQWPSCDPSCKSCGLICDQGCSSPLNYTECTTKCLYCRRESSSCDWVPLTPPSESEFCDQCTASCWCKIGVRCYDNYTSPTTAGGHIPATTARLFPKGLRRM